jgi:hypothetical protein
MEGLDNFGDRVIDGCEDVDWVGSSGGFLNLQ